MEAKENQLTNFEIARVFAMYLGNVQRYRKGVHVITDWGIGCFIEDEEQEYKMVVGKNSFQFIDRLLLLTPLAGITDEHAIEVAGFVFSETVSLNEKIRIGKNFINYTYLGKALGPYDAQDINEFMSEQHIEIFQQLFLWGYAVPIYFGINHWANGKTAIELGIAVDKTLK